MRARLSLLIAPLLVLGACEVPTVGDDGGGTHDGGGFDAGSSDAGTADGGPGDGGTTDGGNPCSDGLTECDGACVDLETSLTSCGACGVACGTDEACVSGDCVLSCGERTECSGACVDTATDPVNCGECGNACDEGEVCDMGACALECSGGLTACGASCVDVSTDAAHCGDCDTACIAPANAEPLCARSECEWECRTGFADCDGDASNGCEADLSQPETCGACDNECTAGTGATPLCDTGTCSIACATDRLDCDGDATNGCEVDSTTIGVASITPADGETLLGRAPTITVTFSSAIVPSAGTVQIAGDMGTAITYDLATAPPEVVFSAGNTVMEIDPARTFPWGETLTLTWSGIHDARCTTSNEVTSPTWSITVNPCEPGRAGMVGVTRTDLPDLATGHPTEVELAVDQRPDGYAYIGGTGDLARLPKMGGPIETGLFATSGITALAPTRPGYHMIVNGDDLFWVSRDRGEGLMVFRLSADGGTTWSTVDYAHFAVRPNDDVRGMSVYDDLLYVLTHEDTTDGTIENQIWSVPADSAVVPAEATLVQSFTDGEYFCGGLAVDARYYYATCALTEHLIRIDRTTGAVEVMPDLADMTMYPMTDSTTQSVAADDVDADGVADYLYVQTEYEATYVVCAPAGPLSEVEARTHFDFGSRNGNYGMSFDPTARRLWLFQDRSDTVFYLE